MKSIQQRTLEQIEQRLTKAGYELAQKATWGNVGTVHIFSDASATTPVGSIGYDFQDGSYKLALTWRGKKIPSQEGRADYFDFYQRYDEPSRFWPVLEKLVSA